MSGYGEFARVYDRLNSSAEYDKREEYIWSLFRKYGYVPTLLLDFACGTGEFSRRIAARGVEVIGVDPSVEMLGIAAEKSSGEVLYLNQDAYSLELYGTVNGAVCCLDSINHITEKEELNELLRKIALYLEPEKLFIFDVNTEFKHREILGDNSFILEENGVFCAWQNYLSEDGTTVDIDLTLFEETKDGTYNRFDECFSERAYSDRELREMLEGAGFEILAILGDMSFDSPLNDSQRNYYVTQRKKNG